MLQTEQKIETLKKQKEEQSDIIKSLKKDLAHEKNENEMLQKKISCGTDVIYLIHDNEKCN